MRNIFALLTGSLFGAGLFVSGMTDTVKVQAWLDIFGAWEPTLAFVLGGAIAPMMIVWRVAGKRKVAVLGNPLPANPSSKLSRSLIVGSFIFGAGWALAGLCPGPSLASITYGGVGGVVFLVAMTAGIRMAGFFTARIERFDANMRH